MSRNLWRLIIDEASPATWNMALDEAIADHVRKGTAPPALRLYAWQRPSVTLGAFQKAKEVDLERCHAMKMPLVRRPTGGRAILHTTEELTYSFSAPTTNEPFSCTLLESYHKLSTAFARAFTSLGLDVHAVTRKRATRSGSPLCFESPSYGELTVFGRKIIGSAQRRKPGGLLQQGSIPLMLDHDLMYKVFGDAGEASAMAGLREFLPDLDVRSLSEAITKAFGTVFKVQLIPSELSEEEEDAARRLVEEKYALERWTLRR